MILGIRLSVYPWGRPLVYADLEPIAVVPMESSHEADRWMSAWRPR